MTVMAATGIAMGYYSGKGLPFFFTTVAAGGPENKSIAGNSYKIHTFVGHNFKYIVPIHIGASFYHVAKG